jgi:SAM-dependent methyltransferase
MTQDNLQLWDEIFKNREWGSYPPLSLVRFIARNYYSAADRSRVKILEIGSAAGANLWYLAREGFTVFGIDGSITACKKAEQRLSQGGYSARIGNILVGDYYNKIDNFKEDYFDAIIDVESLCCNSFQKSQKVIIKLLKKLKPRGKLFSCTFAKGTWGLDAELVDHHACYPIEGPMANEGFNRFTTEDEIPLLYQPPGAKIVTVQRQELHLTKEHKVSEWLIEVQKD